MTEAEYKQAIQLLDWGGLRQLWRTIQQRITPPGWAAGKSFEYAVLRAFELDGATVRYPFTVTLEGQTVEQVDGAVHVGALSCLVEAKDYVAAINFEPVAKMRSQLLRRPAATIGSIFTTSSFTAPALTLAKFLAPQTILLWEAAHFGYALQHERISDLLVRKYQWCAETGEPDFDVTLL